MTVILSALIEVIDGITNARLLLCWQLPALRVKLQIIYQGHVPTFVDLLLFVTGVEVKLNILAIVTLIDDSKKCE